MPALRPTISTARTLPVPGQRRQATMAAAFRMRIGNADAIGFASSPGGASPHRQGSVVLAHRLAAASLLFLLLFLPIPAAGCGGLWCSFNLPVNQAAENVLFVYDDDDASIAPLARVTAVVQILYEGPSNEFAWVLPVPSVPNVTVSSNVALRNLVSATDPQYVLDTKVEGECKEGVAPLGCDECDVSATNGPVDEADDGSSSPVTVELEGSVGPYDFVVISLNTSLSDPADVAVTWLQTNGYDVFDSTADVLGPYLEENMLLVAFRLTKGNDSGAIRPVVLEYESSGPPMIPIRPTAVAANDDMGVRVWVASKSRAVPSNYRTLVLNEALINWFNWRENYDDVVTAAADQAGGQGFVTELAASSSEYGGAIFGDDDRATWEAYKSLSFQDSFDMVQQASWLYRNWDGWRETVTASVTLPSDVSIEDFGQNPNEYRDRVVIDGNKFLQLMQSDVIDPVVATQELLSSQSYLTRLYTTMSAAEMTKDPEFDLNPSLPGVSNIHEADLTIFCDDDLFQWEAPWRIDLPGGGVVTGEGSPWPYGTDDMPANERVVQLSTEGGGTTVKDNSAEIQRKLKEDDKGTSAASSDAGGTRLRVAVAAVVLWHTFNILL